MSDFFIGVGLFFGVFALNLAVLAGMIWFIVTILRALGVL